MLLGIPWQYDRNAKHDGRKNTYVIKKDGISYSLTPLKDEEKTQQVDSSVMIIGEEEFIKTMEEENVGFAIMIKPRNVITTINIDELPSEIQYFLQEYVDIVVDELPKTLPLVRH